MQKKVFLFLFLFLLLSFVFGQEFVFSPNQWFVTNGEGPKNCGEGTSNINDGWTAPQNICATDGSFSLHSTGENYLGVIMDFSQIEQNVSCYSRVNSIKIKFNYKNSNPNSNIMAGVMGGSNYYTSSFKLPSQSSGTEKIVDLTSLKSWTISDALIVKPIVKTSPGANTFQIDSLFLVLDFEKKAEVCNGVDDDCDGQIDEGVKNVCGTCGAVPSEVCNGVDDDCDGQIDETFSCIKNSVGCNDTCSFATRMNQKCSGSIPQNAKQNFGSTDGNFSQTYDGTNWIPSSKIMTHNNTPGECAWVCENDYHFNSSSNQCESNIFVSNCDGEKSSVGIWNDNGQNGVYTYTGTNPKKITHYNETAEDCAWKCPQEMHFDSNITECVSNTRLANCTGTLPQNAKWVNQQNLGKFIQAWGNSTWYPLSKNVFYSENIEECAYGCLYLEKECAYSPDNFCGKGKQDCNKGNWGECVPDFGNICSTNQYCLDNACAFCSKETKNCDLNLLNGCETNITTNTNNCGECGVVCDLNEICFQGVCQKTNPDQNLPIQITCGPNSAFNQITRNCVCNIGYSNCNGSEIDGCEKEGGCNQTPPVIINPDCEFDFECKTNEQCIERKCVPIQVMCTTNTMCEKEYYCSNGDCIKLECKNDFTIVNHECVCNGKICGNECKNEEGICCKGFWNPKISSCEINFEEILFFVNNSNDLEAIELIDRAINSMESGNIAKAKAELAVSNLKAKISKLNDPIYSTAYDDAVVALENKDYELAENIALQTTQSIPEQNDFLFWGVLIVIVLIILGAVFIFWKKTKENNFSEQFGEEQV